MYEMMAENGTDIRFYSRVQCHLVVVRKNAAPFLDTKAN